MFAADSTVALSTTEALEMLDCVIYFCKIITITSNYITVYHGRAVLTLL